MIKRLMKITTGRHWCPLDCNAKQWLETTDCFQRMKRDYTQRLSKLKYGLRKKHFKKYEKNRGVNYMPF